MSLLAPVGQTHDRSSFFGSIRSAPVVPVDISSVAVCVGYQLSAHLLTQTISHAL